MTDKTDKTKPVLNEHAQSVSDALQKALVITIDGDKGHGAGELDQIVPDSYVAQGVSIDTVNQVHAAQVNIVAGLNDGFGRAVLAVAKDNPDVKDYTVVLKGAKAEKFTTTATPRRSGNMAGKSYESFGAVRTHHATSSSSEGGQIGISMANIKELTTAALQSK